jgi:hypothetical protein
MTETVAPAGSPGAPEGAVGITQMEFAKLRGVSEAMVSRWKGRGFLVLDDVGRVLPDASSARLAAMLDPARGGDRTGKPQRAPGAARAIAAAADPDAMNYSQEAARDKRASAMQRELALARDAGDLVPTEIVKSRIADHVRAAVDQLAARRRKLAPVLALETDPRRVEELLADADRKFCQRLANLAALAKLPNEADAS